MEHFRHHFCLLTAQISCHRLINAKRTIERDLNSGSQVSNSASNAMLLVNEGS